jgi:hypothetical protein
MCSWWLLLYPPVSKFLHIWHMWVFSIWSLVLTLPVQMLLSLSYELETWQDIWTGDRFIDTASQRECSLMTFILLSQGEMTWQLVKAWPNEWLALTRCPYWSWCMRISLSTTEDQNPSYLNWDWVCIQLQNSRTALLTRIPQQCSNAKANPWSMLVGSIRKTLFSWVMPSYWWNSLLRVCEASVYCLGFGLLAFISWLCAYCSGFCVYSLQEQFVLCGLLWIYVNSITAKFCHFLFCDASCLWRAMGLG